MTTRRIEAKFLSMDHDNLQIEVADALGNIASFWVPFDKLADPDAIDVFADIMEIDVDAEFVSANGIPFDEWN